MSVRFPMINLDLLNQTWWPIALEEMNYLRWPRWQRVLGSARSNIESDDKNATADGEDERDTDVRRCHGERELPEIARTFKYDDSTAGTVLAAGAELYPVFYSLEYISN